MKKLSAIFAFALFILFSVGNTNVAKAQTTVTDLTAGLINLEVKLLEANVVIGDVTVQDLVDIGNINITDFIDVQNVLNRNEIRILTVELGNITIDDVLTNVLRDANILNKNQVVVGILSGQLVIANANFLRKL